MKYKSLFALAAASLTMLFACQKPVDLGPEQVSIDSEATHEFPVEGGEYTVQLTATVDWTLQGYDENVQSWLSVTPSSGKAATGAQTITIKAIANDGANRQASLVFYGNIMHKAPLTITQKGPDGEGAAITIAEFIEKADTKTEYVLSGVIGDIATNAKYWGFTLKDDTGTISCPFIGATADEFKAMNLHTGDKVNIKGVYQYFEEKSQHQIKSADNPKNGADIVSHEPVSIDAIQTVTVADFIKAADPFTMYRLVGEVSSSVNTQYCSFDIKDDSGTIVVWTVNNAAEYASTLKKGDKVTLRGAYTLFTDKGGNTKHEVVDATIEAVEPGQGGEDPVPGDNIYSNTFASGEGDFTIKDKVISAPLSYVWSNDSRYSCMKASAFVEGQNHEAESWLISPVIDLTGESAAYLTFEHATNFFDTSKLEDEASVWAKEESAETWTKVNGVTYPSSQGWTFVSAGDIDLSAYAGKKMQFAFVYKSTASKSGTWEVKNVVVKNSASEQPEPEPEPVLPEDAIIIDLTTANTDLTWTSANHETYGEGFEATVDAINLGYYQYESKTKPTTQYNNYAVRVYEKSVFSVSSDKTITKIVYYCDDYTSGGKTYCHDLTPVAGEGTYTTNEGAWLIEWNGSANEVVAQAAEAQVRFKKIAIVCE